MVRLRSFYELPPFFLLLLWNEQRVGIHIFKGRQNKGGPGGPSSFQVLPMMEANSFSSATFNV